MPLSTMKDGEHIRRGLTVSDSAKVKQEVRQETRQGAHLQIIFVLGKEGQQTTHILLFISEAYGMSQSIAKEVNMHKHSCN